MTVNCRNCGREILIGETFRTDYPDGEEVTICATCDSRTSKETMIPHKYEVKDGGQAFPRAGWGFAYKDEGSEQEASTDGMTLRDYFAAKAMQGLVERMGLDYLVNRNNNKADISSCAYAVADEMLKARNASK